MLGIIFSITPRKISGWNLTVLEEEKSSEPKHHGFRFDSLIFGGVLLLFLFLLHPGRLTWNPTNHPFRKENDLKQTSMIMVHVHLPGCSRPQGQAITSIASAIASASEPLPHGRTGKTSGAIVVSNQGPELNECFVLKGPLEWDKAWWNDLVLVWKKTQILKSSGPPQNIGDDFGKLSDIFLFFFRWTRSKQSWISNLIVFKTVTGEMDLWFCGLESLSCSRCSVHDSINVSSRLTTHFFFEILLETVAETWCNDII